MQKLFTKHAKIIASIQLLSALMIGGCSIWYGAWYPDAQSTLFEHLRSENPKALKPTFWEVSLHDLGKTSPVIYTGVFLFLGFFSGAGVIASALRLAELEKREKEFKSEQESHAETQQYYYEALRDHLENFFCSQIENFDDTCRASVYRHDANAKLFRMVFRFSNIQRFSSKGRLSLPEDEGIVGATYSNGDSVYVCSLPTKIVSKGYHKEINKKLEPFGTSVSENTLARLRMPSRCYYGYAIRDILSGEKFAILILESTNENHFNSGKISELLSRQKAQISKYVRHIAHIDSKLNPYGGA
jgi:hypothetical protein